MDAQKPPYTVPVDALELQKRALQAFKAIAEHSAVGVAGVDAVQDILDTLLRVAQRAKWRTYRELIKAQQGT